MQLKDEVHINPQIYVLFSALLRQVIETIPTEGYPYDLYYLPWLQEVWVSTLTNSTFDVINTAGKLERTHKAIKAHVEPGWFIHQRFYGLPKAPRDVIKIFTFYLNYKQSPIFVWDSKETETLERA